MNQLIYCPECGTQLRPEGGCQTCPCCGWNSCEWELPSTEEIIRQRKLQEDCYGAHKDKN